MRLTFLRQQFFLLGRAFFQASLAATCLTGAFTRTIEHVRKSNPRIHLTNSPLRLCCKPLLAFFLSCSGLDFLWGWLGSKPLHHTPQALLPAAHPSPSVFEGWFFSLAERFFQHRFSFAANDSTELQFDLLSLLPKEDACSRCHCEPHYVSANSFLAAKARLLHRTRATNFSTTTDNVASQLEKLLEMNSSDRSHQDQKVCAYAIPQLWQRHGPRLLDIPVWCSFFERLLCKPLCHRDAFVKVLFYICLFAQLFLNVEQMPLSGRNLEQMVLATEILNIPFFKKWLSRFSPVFLGHLAWNHAQITDFHANICGQIPEI